MKYDFETLKSRKGTCSGKWAALENGPFAETDYIPYSVADMEFVTPPEIVDAVVERAQFGLYGYTYPGDDFYAAVTGWMRERHNWTVEREWIVPVDGVVGGLYEAVKALTEPGDEVIIQTPVYFPFYAAVEQTGRKLVENPLKIVDGRYEMDYDDLAAKAKDAKAIIVCSPHNPVGRVWAAEELRRMGDICSENGVTVIIDEIHHDFVRPGYHHTAYGTLGEAYAQNAVICTAASKTFSIPGLATSSIVIPNETLRERFKAQLDRDGRHFQGLFGITATTAAYSRCAQWVDEVNEYIDGNFRAVDEFVRERLGGSVYPSEGTYLAWIDLRSYGLAPKELMAFLENDCGVYMNDGAMFGEAGAGFVRMNLACPRRTLTAALERVEAGARQRGYIG